MKNRRNDIIIAARDLIMHYGIKKTNVEDIAEATGMSKASLYHYFNSKEEICLDVILEESNKLKEKIKKSIDQKKDTKEKLIEYFFFRLKHFWQLRNKYKFFFKRIL